MKFKIILVVFIFTILLFFLLFIRKKLNFKKTILFLSIVLVFAVGCFVFNCASTILIILSLFRPDAVSSVLESPANGELFMTCCSFIMDVIIFAIAIKDLKKEHLKITNYELCFDYVKIIDDGNVELSNSRKAVKLLFIEPSTTLDFRYSILPKQISVHMCLCPDVFEGKTKQEFEAISKKPGKEWILRDIIIDLKHVVSDVERKNKDLICYLSFESEIPILQGLLDENNFFYNDTNLLIVDFEYVIAKKKIAQNSEKAKLFVNNSTKTKSFIYVFQRKEGKERNIFEYKK